MLGEMFDLDQTSPNIAKHDARSPNKVCKRSNISPNMTFAQAFSIGWLIFIEQLDLSHPKLPSLGGRAS